MNVPTDHAGTLFFLSELGQNFFEATHEVDSILKLMLDCLAERPVRLFTKETAKPIESRVTPNQKIVTHIAEVTQPTGILHCETDCCIEFVTVNHKKTFA